MPETSTPQREADRSAPTCSPSFRARFDATKAALEGKKLDANPYGEDDPLHWQWLDAWASTKMEISKANSQARSSSD